MSDRRTFVLGACAACVACGGDPEGDPVLPDPVVENGVMSLPLADYPDLQPVGGAVAFANPGGFGAVLVAQTSSNTFEAWSRRCTHQGCLVGYQHGSQRLHCGCHGSNFDLNGAVITGPAVSPLTEYPTTFDGTTVAVTLD